MLVRGDYLLLYQTYQFVFNHFLIYFSEFTFEETFKLEILIRNFDVLLYIPCIWKFLWSLFVDHPVYPLSTFIQYVSGVNVTIYNSSIRRLESPYLFLHREFHETKCLLLYRAFYNRIVLRNCIIKRVRNRDNRQRTWLLRVKYYLGKNILKSAAIY